MNTEVLHPITVRLRSTVRGLETRPGVLIEGPGGWGEWSPVPGFPCDPRLALEAAREAAHGQWARPTRTAIRVNALVGDDFDADRDAPGLAGYPCVKVKVGDLDDVERVARVRDALGPDVAIRVDANGRWDTDTACARLEAMSRYGIELAEQPVAALEDLALVRRRSSVPIAADECLRSREDVRRMRALGAADAVVLKVQACGGVNAALSWAEEAGVPVIVTSMLETSVGLAAGVALAAALPESPYACGLGTGALLAADVTTEPLIAHDGSIAVRAPVVDRELLAACAADAIPQAFAAALDGGS